MRWSSNHRSLFRFLHSSLWHFSKSSTIHSFPFFKKHNSFSKTLIFFFGYANFFLTNIFYNSTRKIFFCKKKKRKTFRSTFRRFWRNFIIVQTKFFFEIKKIIWPKKYWEKFLKKMILEKKILTKMKNWFWNENFIEKCERMCEVWGAWGLAKGWCVEKFEDLTNIEEQPRRQWHKIKGWIGTENEEKLSTIEA